MSKALTSVEQRKQDLEQLHPWKTDGIKQISKSSRDAHREMLEQIVGRLSMNQVAGCLRLAVELASEKYPNDDSLDIGLRVAAWGNKMTDYRNHFKSALGIE